jgi:hypothetical protein
VIFRNAIRRLFGCFVIGFVPQLACAATDPWEMPPMRYSETAASDVLAKMAADSADGEIHVEGKTPLEKLRFVLRLLDVPEESQILVFSKTSKQNPLISPDNPRCLFFNENSYIGYVPGGDIEVITHDPRLGVVFYMIRAGSAPDRMRVARQGSQCLSCHGSARTESVPGVLVRSVFPDESGQPLFSLGSFLIDHTSPMQERWGGYYVTGRSSLPHLGNRTFVETPQRVLPETAVQLDSVDGRIDTSRYLRATSDIVALMVLEHQCRVHNTLVAAGMNHRRMHWLQKSINPEADPDDGDVGRIADEAAARIADLLLFENEAPLGEDGIVGDTAFQDAFVKRFPQTTDGRSLAEFQLYSHLFKHRCSYMIYSEAFRSLPDRIRKSVIARLHHILTSKPAPGPHSDLGASSRKRIAAILSETLPGWPG